MRKQDQDDFVEHLLEFDIDLEDQQTNKIISNKINQLADPEPTQKEIQRFLIAFQNKFPEIQPFKAFSKIYNKLIVPTLKGKQDNLSIASKQAIDNEKMQFSIITKTIKPKQRMRPVSQIQRQQAKKAEKKNISEQVYNRYNRTIRKDKPSNIVDFSAQNQQNLRRVQDWKIEVNKQHRLYTNKVAPKFNCKDDEIKYYEKRLCAKAFIERGYGIFKLRHPDSAAPQSIKPFPSQIIQEQEQEPSSQIVLEKHGGSLIQNQSEEEYLSEVSKLLATYGLHEFRDKRRYKTVSSAFIGQSFRRFQLFMMEECGRKLRQVTGPQIRALYIILLNSQQLFGKEQYDTFRKFIKLTFDLGSISVYEDAARNLYIQIQTCLRDRALLGINQDMMSQGLSDYRTFRQLPVMQPQQQQAPADDCYTTIDQEGEDYDINLEVNDMNKVQHCD